VEQDERLSGAMDFIIEVQAVDVGVGDCDISGLFSSCGD
jgi:hypothetical protein